MELVQTADDLWQWLEGGLAKYDDDQPRAGDGKWTSGGGGGGDPHARATESLKDPAFVSQHADRISRAGDEARTNFPGREHGDEAHAAAQAHIHGEVMRIHAEQDLHQGDATAIAQADWHRRMANFRGEGLIGEHRAAMESLQRSASDIAWRRQQDSEAQSRGFRDAAHEGEHQQTMRDQEAQSRGFADHAAERDHQYAEEQRQNRENEDQEIAAGHVTSEARDIASQYMAGHEAREAQIDQHVSALTGAHQEAAQALANLHAFDASEDLEHTRSLVTDHLDDTQNTLDGLAGRDPNARSPYDRIEAEHEAPQIEHEDDAPLHPDDPDHPEPPENDSERATMLAAHTDYLARRDAHDAAYAQHAEHAQSALERLHEHQVAAMAGFKTIHAEGEKAHDSATEKLGAMGEGHHIREDAFAGHERDEDGAFVNPAVQDAYESAGQADETMTEHASSLVAQHAPRDVSDARETLKDETKTTAAAIKELSKVTGRAPRLAGKTKKGLPGYCTECGRQLLS